jgi:hypothetical protein
MTPHECIKEAIMHAAGQLDDSGSKEKQLFELADTVIQFLDAEGYTIVERDAVWRFHDSLETWLNQDADGHRLGTFMPYQDWLAVWRKLPPRRKYDVDGSLL